MGLEEYNKQNKKKYLLGLILFILFAYSIFSLNLDITKLSPGLTNIIILFSDALPPDGSVLEVSLFALIETLMIAFVGTIIGFIVSLPLAILSSRNLSSKGIIAISRVILAAIRTIPSLLWAIIFVIAVGFGNLAGVLAISVYTIGYLSKLQYETFEGINPNVIEAVNAIGPDKFSLIRYVIVPESANNLLSQLLFMFEYNVRASSILGFVGAGGIGFYLSSYLKFLDYDKVLVLLGVIFVTVLIIDYISVRLRDKYLS